MTHMAGRWWPLPAAILIALAASQGAHTQNVPEPVMQEDQLAPQWNENGARVASCPAFHSAPQVEHLTGWGWTIVHFQVLDEPKAETRDYDNPASPTGASRMTALRFKAAVLRASSDLPPTVVVRFITDRAAIADGQVQASSSDPLDGRPGRAPVGAGQKLFGIVFPDPYAPGELGLAAVFVHEDELVTAINQGASAPPDFDTLAETVRQQRAQAEAQVPSDPRPE
jgi:hypothetical protein